MEKSLEFQIVIKELTILTCLIFLEEIQKICFFCLFVFNIQLPANVCVYVLHVYMFETERKMEREKERKILLGYLSLLPFKPNP